jgi:UDP-N-acetyl-D-glucosamine dehydrogenase
MDFVGKVKERTARVGVIGLGYVGLPLVIEFGKRGFTVSGFDVDKTKVQALNAGSSYIHHIPAADVLALVNSGKFRAYDDFSKLAQQDAILIAVPTPLTEMREPDVRYVEQTAREIARCLQPGQLVVLESTTYPGTTDELVLPILESSGLKCPADGGAGDQNNTFLLAFSPERVDPGNEKFPIPLVPKVVGGRNSASRAAAAALYGAIIQQVVEVSSTRVAEMSKLLENIYRCVNIALVNELKLLCLRMGIDIWEVIAASSTKPYGFTPFYPGPGLGGHCIPIDPFYLSWKARQFDFSTRFIELAGEVNTSMPYHVVTYLADALNERKKALNGSRILMLGIAYKKDVDDLRESPSLKLIELLRERGALVEYNDPYIPRLHRTRKYDFPLESVPLDPARLASYDCVLIATDHSCYDYQAIVNHASLVIDTRNATRNVCAGREKVVRC